MLLKRVAEYAAATLGEDTEDRGRVSHAEIVLIGLPRADVCLKMSYVHTLLKAVTFPAMPDMNDRINAVSPSPGGPRQVVREHHRDGEVVVGWPSSDDREESAAAGVQPDRQHPRQNDEAPASASWEIAAIQGCAARRHRARGHRALHDEESVHQ